MATTRPALARAVAAITADSYRTLPAPYHPFPIGALVRLTPAMEIHYPKTFHDACMRVEDPGTAQRPYTVGRSSTGRRHVFPTAFLMLASEE